MEKPAVRTTIDKITFARAVIKAWPSVSDLPCTKEAVGVLWAQYWVETGGRACWNWNIGNVKSVGGQDFHYLRDVWEGASPEQAKALIAAGRATPDPSPEHAKLVGPGRISVLFNRPQPEARFRWFASLDDAMREYISLLAKKKFASAWPHVVTGDVLAFAKELKERRYFTASASAYANIMRPAFSLFVASPAFEDAVRAIIVPSEAPTLPDLSALAIAVAPDELPTVPDLPVREDDGGASRHRATMDAVAEMARQRYRGE